MSNANLLKKKQLVEEGGANAYKSDATTTPTTDPYQDLINQIKSQQEKVDEYMNAYNNNSFNFNLNGNALYNQYKDQYTKQAQMGMEDAIGRASALTGGYGNSYAQAVGQQAYYNQMDGLNDVAMRLYEMAYGQYQDQQAKNLQMAQYYSGLASDSEGILEALRSAGGTGGDERVVTSLAGLERVEEELKNAKNMSQVNAILDKYRGIMTQEQEDVLYDIYYKDESSYKDNEGNSNYLAMFEHPELWDYYDDGGWNGFWGLDNDAGLVAPDGTHIEANALVDYLKKNGYKGNAYKDVIKMLEDMGIN
jgi:hypothetical protein